MADQNQQHQTVNPIQVQKFLGGIDYPADKQAIIQAAQREGASREVIDTIQRIGDRRYDSPTDISKEIGKLI